MATYDEIKKGGAILTCHVNGGHFYIYNYGSKVEPRIVKVKSGPKGKSKRALALKVETYYMIRGQNEVYANLMEAFIALQKGDGNGAVDRGDTGAVADDASMAAPAVAGGSAAGTDRSVTGDP